MAGQSSLVCEIVAWDSSMKIAGCSGCPKGASAELPPPTSSALIAGLSDYAFRSYLPRRP
jgi:hypothetical protein